MLPLGFNFLCFEQDLTFSYALVFLNAYAARKSVEELGALSRILVLRRFPKGVLSKEGLLLGCHMRAK